MDPMNGRTVNKIYKIGDMIGIGNNGEIYEGINDDTDEKVAVKLEPLYEISDHLLSERLVYCTLGLQEGFAAFKWFGEEWEYRIMVMELLGPSLSFMRRRQRFSVPTVLMIAIQLISRFEYLHSKSYVHGSVKPANFSIGKGDEKDVIYMFDFGRSRRYRDPNTYRHITCGEDGVIFTGQFFSVNACQGITYSRRDDMQSLGYMLLYLLDGSLPWSDCQDFNQSLNLKKSFNIDDDYYSGYSRKLFKEYMTYVMALKFEDCPDYEYFRQKFQTLLLAEVRNGCWKLFDWSGTESLSTIQKFKESPKLRGYMKCTILPELLDTPPVSDVVVAGGRLKEYPSVAFGSVRNVCNFLIILLLLITLYLNE